MTKGEVVKLLVLIEHVYSNCIFKDETVKKWFELCAEMDFEKVMVKLKNHIRFSPYPPVIAEIAVLKNHEIVFQERLQGQNYTNRPPIPDWHIEYSIRKSV